MAKNLLKPLSHFVTAPLLGEPCEACKAAFAKGKSVKGRLTRLNNNIFVGANRVRSSAKQ